jgi:hypothetical protein
MKKLLLALLVCGLSQAPLTVWALKIQTLDLKRHHRFYEGSDKAFVGDPYDWSGVARTWDVGKWGAMISPSYFISANHFHPANGETFRFYHGNSTNTTYEERVVISGQRISDSDIWLGKLSAPVSSAVAKYPVLQLPSENDYYGKKIHFCGRPSDNNQATNSQARIHMGLSRLVNTLTMSGLGRQYYWYRTDLPFGGDTALQAEGGDSGGSSFIAFNGIPTLLGTHYSYYYSTFIPYYISDINNAMSASGEQVTVITLNTTPALPLNFTARFVSNGAALQWTDISDTETGYQLERRTAGGTFAPLQTLAANAVSFTDNSAVPSISYEFRLRAYNTVSTSAWTTVYLARQEHALPYNESFESLAAGMWLPGFEGWSSQDPSAARVSTNASLLASLNAYTQPIGYPLRAEGHAQMGAIEGAVTNRISATSGTPVWCDMMAELTRTDGPLPTPPAELQCAVIVDSEGRLNVWHRDVTGAINRWTTLAWQTAQPSQWARVTLHLDYSTIDATHNARYFQLFIDGVAQSNELAYTANNGSGVSGGTWFAMTSASAPSGMRSLFFDGIGTLDDLVVDTARPLIGMGPHGTPEWWLADNGLTNALSLAANELADGDSDGFLNWKEYAAGTSPTNDASLLRFTSMPVEANGRFGLMIQTIPGQRYTLEGSSTLEPDSWVAAAFALTSEGTPSLQTITATEEALTFYVEADGPLHFFRVQVVQ